MSDSPTTSMGLGEQYLPARGVCKIHIILFNSQPMILLEVAGASMKSEKRKNSSLQMLTLVHVRPFQRVLLSICKYLFWSGYSARKCFYDRRILHRHPLIIRHLRAFDVVPLSIALYNKLAHCSCWERPLLKKSKRRAAMQI